VIDDLIKMMPQEQNDDVILNKIAHCLPYRGLVIFLYALFSDEWIGLARPILWPPHFQISDALADPELLRCLPYTAC
jgi:hypothetical protein